MKRIVMALLSTAAMLGATVVSGPSAASLPVTAGSVLADELPYGTDGKGNPKTEDCTVSTSSNPQKAVDCASAGDIICVKPGDYSSSTLTVGKAVTVRANGVVKLKNIVVSGSNATIDGFTVVGDELDDPSATTTSTI